MLCVEIQSRIEFGFNKWHWTHINYDFYDDEFYETTRWNYRVCNGFQPQHGWTSLNWHLTCCAASSLTLTSNRNLFDFPSPSSKADNSTYKLSTDSLGYTTENCVNVFLFSLSVTYYFSLTWYLIFSMRSQERLQHNLTRTSSNRKCEIIFLHLPEI